MTGAAAAFAAIAANLLGADGVTDGTGFGPNPGLRVNGKIFALLVGGDLVVKLPAERCLELAASSWARPFERGRGTPLREWIVVEGSASAEWPALAREALAFVAG